jgi:hypothetical protein
MSQSLLDILQDALNRQDDETLGTMWLEPHDVPTFKQEVDANLNDIHYEIDEGYAKLPLDMSLIEYAVRWTMLNLGMEMDWPKVSYHMQRYNMGL